MVSAAGHAAVGDQFYVTHCTTADSVTNSPGYSVRAASADAPEVLTRALEYPPYEIPLELWRDKPAKPQTPRRLARTKNPAGGVWVAHSVFLDKDTMNRDRSYFTHLLGLPASVDAASVLESWDADGWAKDYPQGAPKELEKCPLPVGTKVSRAALAAFLGRSVGGSSDLATVVCPTRFRADPAGRRALVARFLKAVLLVAKARAAGGERDRLFVHAEPGLVAMLLYAAARILPPALTADLTFSTFEPAHRGLRDYADATVIGTYLAAPGKGLDPDLVTTRGFGFDAVHAEKSSPELVEGTPVPAGVADLLDLAAAGEWELIDAVHKFNGADPAAVEKVPATVPLARAAVRLTRGGLTGADLVALKHDRRGAAVLKQREEKVWEFLKDAVLADAALRAEFRDWVADPERLKVFRREACEALVRGDFDGWDQRWAVVREAADAKQFEEQADRGQKNLDRYLPTLPLPARDRVRAVCAESGAWPDHHLLAPAGLDELDELLGPKVPPEWQGYTCFAVMGPDEKNWLLDTTRAYRPAMRERVRHHLAAASRPVLAAYLKHAKDYVSTMPGFLYDFLKPYRPESPNFLSRLIDAGADVIDPADWVKLLADLDIYGEQTPEWRGFLLKADNLAKLLGGMKAHPAAVPVWDGYTALLTPKLVAGDEWELVIYGQLTRARQVLGAANVLVKDVVPPAGLRKLRAADTLLGLFANPAAAEALEPGQLLEAYQVFGIDPIDGLRGLYLRFNFAAIDLNASPLPLRPFAAAFKSCFPVGHEYPSARNAAAAWVALSMSCPDSTRGAFQTYLLREFVPAHWHANLLAEAPRIVLHPVAVAYIGEVAAATHAQNTSFLDADDPPPKPQASVGFESEATQKARGGRKIGPARRREAGVPGYLWVAVGLVGLAVVGAAVVAAIKKNAPKPVEQDTPVIVVPSKESPPKTKPKDTKTKDKDK
ncbi:unnamed protein product [Gemmataceae bacterium]|nr:unnamed protein product [Gemmataceae bacterium]VTU00702.1 unnamed protein product [Gemmataceae bacterium]